MRELTRDEISCLDSFVRQIDESINPAIPWSFHKDNGFYHLIISKSVANILKELIDSAVSFRENSLNSQV